jgi:hypothetical protein
MKEKIAKSLSFTKAHFVSALVASIIIFLAVILSEKGLSHMPKLYVLKVLLALYLGVAVVAFPFSIIFFGLPELYGKIMPVWLFGLLGAGFGLIVMMVLYVGSGGGPKEGSEIASFGIVLFISGFAAGAVFGAMRRRSFLRHFP